MRKLIEDAFYLKRGQVYYGVHKVLGENLITKIEKKPGEEEIGMKVKWFASWYSLKEAEMHQQFLKSKGVEVDLTPVII